MIDDPGVDVGLLATQVAQAWEIDVADLTFLPVGLDGQAWAYRIETSGGRRYFLKLRRDGYMPAALVLPGFLRAHGVGQVVAPIELPGGKAGHEWGDYRLLLYPFHDGGSLWERGLTDRQWVEYGELMGRLHAVKPSAEVAAILPTEDFRSGTGERLRTLGVRAASSQILGTFWGRYGDALHRLSETVEELASRVSRPGFVICHTDIHPGNLIADGDGPLHVVDWDTPMLAPRERDLMFVYSRDFGDHPIDAHRAGLFRQGYGPAEPDQSLLSYYRDERRLDDVATFIGSILDPGASEQARANDLHWLTRIAGTLAGQRA